MPLKVSTCRPTELNATEMERWRSFQRFSDELQSPFFSPELACAFGRHHPGIEVAILEEDGTIAAFFPYERCALGIGKALGYGLIDKQGVIHAPGFSWRGIELIQACKLVTWEFDSLIASQVKYFAPQECYTRASPRVDLSQGWQTWMERRRSEKRFKRIRQLERKLRREVGDPEYEFTSRSRCDLNHLMSWKSDQYRRTCRTDRFALGWFTEMVRELTSIQSDTFSVNLSSMRAAGQLVSLDLSLCANGTMAGWFPAYNREYSRFGVGLLHLQALLRLGHQNGFKSYDLGAGEEEYKSAFCDDSPNVATGSLRQRTSVATVRWIQMAPKRAAVRFVLSRPALRKVARRALNRLGRIRVRLAW